MSASANAMPDGGNDMQVNIPDMMAKLRSEMLGNENFNMTSGVGGINYDEGNQIKKFVPSQWKPDLSKYKPRNSDKFGPPSDPAKMNRRIGID